MEPLKRLRHLLKQLGYFIPFTVYLLVFAAILIPGYNWLHKLSKLPDSAYKDIITLLLTIALVFCLAVLIFGFITVATSFIYFKVKLRKGLLQFNLNTPDTKKEGRQTQFIALTISPILVPLVGFLRVRLLYDQQRYSEKFSLVAGNNRFFGLSYTGGFNWNLPEIREYQVQQVVLYFEDFFQFFSMATRVTVHQRFHISPQSQGITALNASPRKTEETKTRIEELKRVEGELINYKNFENNDDVRRIVWKIYAKNKELVVRIPEIMDPYASHIYLYTSFYSQFNVDGNAALEAPLLNYYKTLCWSVHQQLSKKGFEVRYVADQPIPPGNLSEPDEQVKYAISVSKWQSTSGILDVVKPGNASVLIISSLNDAEQVKQFSEQYGLDVSLIYIPLSDALEGNKTVEWLKWLFVETEDKGLSAYKRAWSLSPLRLKIKQNEKVLSKVVNNSEKSSILTA